MGTAWMDKGIGAERDIRRNSSKTTTIFACLPSISMIKSYKPTSQPGIITLIFLLTIS